MNKEIINKEIINKGIKYLISTILIIFIFIDIIYENIPNEIFAWLLIVSSSYLLFYTRKNINLFLIIFPIFYFNYSIAIARYLYPVSSKIEGFIVDPEIYKIGIQALNLFIGIIILFLPNKIYSSKSKLNPFLKILKKNRMFVIGMSMILCLILIFGYTRPDIKGVRGIPTPLYEYSIIIFIVIYSYTKKSIRLKFILLSIMSMFVIQNFIFGGRATGVQILLVFLLFLFSNKIKYKTMFLLAIIGIFLMVLIGSYRATFAINMEMIKNTFKSIINEKLVLDTATSAFYTSITFIKYKMDVTTKEEIVLAVNFIKSIFFGGMIENSNLSIITRNYYNHNFGGVLPVYFYFWFGWIGVLLSGFIIQYFIRIINRLNYEKSEYKRLLACYIIVTCPRWYLYSPTAIFRGTFLFTVFYYGLLFLNNIFKIITKKGKVINEI